MKIPTAIDFHCHVDLYPDPPALVAESDRLGICTLAVTTTPRAWPQNREWTVSSSHVRAALGMHPQLIASHAHELPLFEKYLIDSRFVGEVGLDAGPHHAPSFEAQLRVFTRILDACAEQGGKILSIHSVRSASKVLDLIERHLPAERGRAVLHWFTGTKAEAKRAIDLGCYFSINAQMLKSQRTGLLETLPISRILTETDGPFTVIDGQPSRPFDAKATLASLATALSIPSERLITVMADNLRVLVSEA